MKLCINVKESRAYIQVPVFEERSIVLGCKRRIEADFITKHCEQSNKLE